MNQEGQPTPETATNTDLVVRYEFDDAQNFNARAVEDQLRSHGIQSEAVYTTKDQNENRINRWLIEIRKPLDIPANFDDEFIGTSFELIGALRASDQTKTPDHVTALKHSYGSDPKFGQKYSIDKTDVFGELLDFSNTSSDPSSFAA